LSTEFIGQSLAGSYGEFFEPARRTLRTTRYRTNSLGCCCYSYLANAGQDTRAIQLYLGHKNIQHTVRYTELSAQGFKDFWKD